jgi:hypothetical protein
LITNSQDGFFTLNGSKFLFAATILILRW